MQGPGPLPLKVVACRTQLCPGSPEPGPPARPLACTQLSAPFPRKTWSLLNKTPRRQNTGSQGFRPTGDHIGNPTLAPQISSQTQALRAPRSCTQELPAERGCSQKGVLPAEGGGPSSLKIEHLPLDSASITPLPRLKIAQPQLDFCIYLHIGLETHEYGETGAACLFVQQTELRTLAFPGVIPSSLPLLPWPPSLTSSFKSLVVAVHLL